MKFFLKSKKKANQKLGNLGNIIPSFLMPGFVLYLKTQI